MENQEQIVAIIGAGLIGRSWANVFARAGWQVQVWDPSAEQRELAPGQIALSLRELEGAWAGCTTLGQPQHASSSCTR